MDPSLAVAAVGASAGSLLRDLNAFGYLFESLAIRDCRTYCDPLDGVIYHYRDSDGLEVDVICETPGAWGAFEVKPGIDGLEQGAASLLKFAEKVDTSRIGEPGVLGVITATGYGYTRPDGVVASQSAPSVPNSEGRELTFPSWSANHSYPQIVRM